MTSTLSNGIFTLYFHRNTNAVDVSLFVERGTVLDNNAPWYGIVTNINGGWGIVTNLIESGTNPVAVTVTVPAPAGTNALFRLRVTRP
jgi:hypothetical protein